jgi:hypothetical protein
MMNVALWQWAWPLSDGHVHPDNEMSSWFDVLSHWVTHGWLSATEQSGYNPATIRPTIQLKFAIKQGLIKTIGDEQALKTMALGQGQV